VLQQLPAGANIHSKDDVGYTALHRACSNINFKHAALLIKAGADINLQTKHGETPLHTTCIAFCDESNLHKKDRVIALLLNSGAKQLPNPNGETPLHFYLHAHLPSSRSMTKRLITCGANIYARDRWGKVPGSTNGTPPDELISLVDEIELEKMGLLRDRDLRAERE
jgi:ankyrin repeat protein